MESGSLGACLQLLSEQPPEAETGLGGAEVGRRGLLASPILSPFSPTHWTHHPDAAWEPDWLSHCTEQGLHLRTNRPRASPRLQGPNDNPCKVPGPLYVAECFKLCILNWGSHVSLAFSSASSTNFPLTVSLVLLLSHHQILSSHFLAHTQQQTASWLASQ